MTLSTLKMLISPTSGLFLLSEPLWYLLRHVHAVNRSLADFCHVGHGNWTLDGTAADVVLITAVRVLDELVSVLRASKWHPGLDSFELKHCCDIFSACAVTILPLRRDNDLEYKAPVFPVIFLSTF